jgi:aspartate/tyrosine/aromatic aminotransferase
MNKLNNVSAILQGPTSLNAQIQDIKMAPPDAILGTNVAFQKDTSDNKIHLGVGAYRDADGKPYTFKIVQKIESALHSKVQNHVFYF